MRAPVWGPRVESLWLEDQSIPREDRMCIRLEIEAFTYGGEPEVYVTPIETDEWLRSLGTYDSELSEECREWIFERYEDGYPRTERVIEWLYAKYGKDNVHGYDGGEPWDVDATGDTLLSEECRFVWAFTPDGEMAIQNASGSRYAGPFVWVLNESQSEGAILEFDRASGECDNGHFLRWEVGGQVHVDGRSGSYRLSELARFEVDERGNPIDDTVWLACPECGGRVDLYTDI